MKVLILGSGGREHALVWKLSQSKDVSKIYAMPGNGGISDIAECIEMDTGNIGNLIEFSRSKGIDLVVVGSETFLAQGIVDAFEEKGIPIFGPRRKGALIETSKIFAKELMDQYKVPTAPFKTFSEYEKARILRYNTGATCYQGRRSLRGKRRLRNKGNVRSKENTKRPHGECHLW